MTKEKILDALFMRDVYSNKEAAIMQKIHDIYMNSFIRLDKMSTLKIEETVLEMTIYTDNDETIRKPAKDNSRFVTSDINLMNIDPLIRDDITDILANFNNSNLDRIDEAWFPNLFWNKLKDNDPFRVFTAFMRDEIIDIALNCHTDNINSMNNTIIRVNNFKKFLTQIWNQNIFKNEQIMTDALSQTNSALNDLSKEISDMIPSISLKNHIKELHGESVHLIKAVIEMLGGFGFDSIKQQTKFTYKKLINNKLKLKINKNIFGIIILDAVKIIELKNGGKISSAVKNPFINNTSENLVDYYVSQFNENSSNVTDDMTKELKEARFILSYIIICQYLIELKQQTEVIKTIENYFQDFGDIIGTLSAKNRIEIFFKCTKELLEKLNYELKTLKDKIDNLKILNPTDIYISKDFAYRRFDDHKKIITTLNCNMDNIILGMQNCTAERGAESIEMLNLHFCNYANRLEQSNLLIIDQTRINLLRTAPNQILNQATNIIMDRNTRVINHPQMVTRVDINPSVTMEDITEESVSTEHTVLRVNSQPQAPSENVNLLHRFNAGSLEKYSLIEYYDHNNEKHQELVNKLSNFKKFRTIATPTGLLTALFGASGLGLVKAFGLVGIYASGGTALIAIVPAVMVGGLIWKKGSQEIQIKVQEKFWDKVEYGMGKSIQTLTNHKYGKSLITIRGNPVFENLFKEKYKKLVSAPIINLVNNLHLEGFKNIAILLIQSITPKKGEDQEIDISSRQFKNEQEKKINNEDKRTLKIILSSIFDLKNFINAISTDEDHYLDHDQDMIQIYSSKENDYDADAINAFRSLSIQTTAWGLYSTKKFIDKFDKPNSSICEEKAKEIEQEFKLIELSK